MCILYIIDNENLWHLRSCLSGGGVKFTKTADPDKHLYSLYGRGFYPGSSYSLSSGNRFGKNVIVFRVDNRSSVHIIKTERHRNS